MILKTLRWKSQRFDALINYILTDRGRIVEGEDQTFAIYHNLPSIEKKEIGIAFRKNDQFRQAQKNAKVTLYHEILSFAPDDREELDQAKLEDIARAYIDIRNPNALCLAKPHIENDNVHIHFMFSGTEYKSKKTLRMDNERFSKVRRSIEAYQLKQYPELANSVVYLNKPVRQKINSITRDHNTRKERQYQMTKRVGERQLDKAQLSEMVQRCFADSKSFKGFLSKLQQEGLESYEYRGKTKGVVMKRKYRFTTLGIDKTRLQKMIKRDQNIESRTAELDALYTRKQQRVQQPLHPDSEEPDEVLRRREQELIDAVNRRMRESRDLDR